MQAVFHTEMRLDDHADREREKYVSDLLSQGLEKSKGLDQAPHHESHDETIAFARQLINIGERSSIGRNGPLGISYPKTSIS